MKQLTRRQFHDLVWSKPMTKLAQEFGLSDVALHKACRKHRIPTPGPGYWNKVAAGKPVTKGVFHEINDAALNNMRLSTGWRHALPPEVQEARAQAEAACLEHPVASVSGELHPLVKRMQRKLVKSRLQKQKSIKLHEPDLFSVMIAPASTARLITFLNRLVMEAEGRGYSFKAGDALKIQIEGEAVSFHILEKADWVPHLPTAKEEAALKRWEIECANKRKRGQYIHEWEKPKIPEFDSIFNGHLVIQIDQPGYHGDGLRRKFSDGARYRLEERIENILITAATCAALIKSRRAADERREQERQEEERLAAIQRRQERLEQKRADYLEQYRMRWRKAEDIRAFVLATEARLQTAQFQKPEDRTKVEEWLVWARGHADEIDPWSEALPLLLQESDLHSWELG